jgi:energy-coupling factor transporter ATP-binding protein EcfA2
MRLHELHINNFKFFPKQDPSSPLLKIDGKNLLVYGENGSGKSTIYWSIYTLLESAFKINEFDVEKYFEKGTEYGLVNIHATANQPAYIKMILKDNAGNPIEYYVDGEVNNIVAIMRNSAIRESGMASDFINYRVIFRLHNLKHSKENNLFGWFEDEIFPYILIASINSTKSVGDVFKELKKGPAKVKAFDEIDKMVFPNPSMQHHSEEAVQKDFKKYQKYLKEVKKWNIKLKAYLQGITTRANQILSTDFQQNFEIKLDYTFAKVNITSNDLGWEDPIIELKIPVYNGKRNVVKRPHTFLNEAKWTSIGLSIRLAIIEDWTNRPATAQLKVLVIDDMLLSLDMSNRDIVLNILLDRYVNDYQLIMLTHDRYFFELAQGKIHARNTGGDWLKLEMYEDMENGKSKPLILKSKTNLERAKSFLAASR